MGFRTISCKIESFCTGATGLLLTPSRVGTQWEHGKGGGNDEHELSVEE